MSEIKDILGSALEELRNVEGDLAKALAEEHQIEARIGADEARIEEIAEELAPHSKIIVNGRSRVVEGRSVSFEEAVKLAFPSGPTKPNTKFTVTYRNAAQVPAAAELDPGQNVKVKPGHHKDEETIFNVTETVLS